VRRFSGKSGPTSACSRRRRVQAFGAAAVEAGRWSDEETNDSNADLFGVSGEVTRDRWHLITTAEHPVLAGREGAVRTTFMAEVKVFYDREGRTLTVWFVADSLRVALESVPA